eukprot:jgi/Bigna1/142521/aug1.70_g17229
MSTSGDREAHNILQLLEQEGKAILQDPTGLLKSYVKEWQTDLIERVVPFWLNHSLDKKNGGYYTALDEDGSIYDTDKYLWLQGREVFTFSKLVNTFCEGGMPLKTINQWAQAAKIGAEALDKALGNVPGVKDPRIYFSATEDWKLLHYQRKPYATVFYSLGCLEYSSMIQSVNKLQESGQTETKETIKIVFGKEDAAVYAAKAKRSFQEFEEMIKDPTNSGRPAGPKVEGLSKLADVMCVVALACEFLQKSSSEEEKTLYKARIGKLLERAKTHFHPKYKILLENSRSSGPSTATPDGRLFNPGHCIEVGWMLLEACKHVPNKEIETMALIVIENSLEIGWDKQYGGLFYMMDIEGKPLLDSTVTAKGKLWWPHSEALIAVSMVLRVCTEEKRPKWLVWLAKLQKYCQLMFVDKKHGGWYGYRERDGTLHSTVKGGNYKGFFHTPRALSLSAKAIKSFLDASK